MYWVDINLAQKKGLKFYQTRSNSIILHETLPAYCIPKVVGMGTGEVIYDKVYASPRPPPKISLKHDWKKELGSEVALQAEVSQPTQPNPNPNHDRTERPVVCSEGAPRSSNQEIDTRPSSDCKNFNLDAGFTSQTRFSSDSKNLNLKEYENHYRTGRPVVCSERARHSSDQDIETRLSCDSKNFNFEEDVNHYRTVRLVVCSQQERSMSDEVGMNFRISGLPHSVVKQVESSRVRELIEKIENHPHRQDLQFDLRQNKAYNPFSERSKKMIKDMGDVEMFELCETNPKTQCTGCLL